MTSKNDRGCWDANLSKVILEINGPGFWFSLESALKSLVSFEFIVVFAYRGDETPINLYHSFDPRRVDIHVTKYLEGPYLLDPFFQACSAKISSGLYRLREIAPDRFYQSEYYRSYYKETTLAEEIGYLTALPKDTYMVISLMRTQSSAAFSAKEFKHLREIEKTVSALSLKHWQHVEATFSKQHTSSAQKVIQKRIVEVLRTFGETVLTPRECEVVSLVLRGFSSDAIAAVLGIATGTVKTYRRSIYAKLGISSQAELFSMFISALQISPPPLSGHPDPDPDQDR